MRPRARRVPAAILAALREVVGIAWFALAVVPEPRVAVVGRFGLEDHAEVRELVVQIIGVAREDGLLADGWVSVNNV